MVEIFVFGSNLAGRHGKGAALFAKENHGAIYGKGWGRQGNSYGIPTKGWKLEVLPLTEIEKYVIIFLQYAMENPELEFKVTAIGCGLAGYLPEEIAPFFKNVPKNVHLPKEFQQVIGGK